MGDTVQAELSKEEYEKIKDQLTDDFVAIYMAKDGVYLIQFDSDYNHYFTKLLKNLADY